MIELTHDPGIVVPALAGRLRARFRLKAGLRRPNRSSSGTSADWASCGWFRPREFERIYGPQKIGPDALEISACRTPLAARPSRRAIKVALLDQKVSGRRGKSLCLGNLASCRRSSGPILPAACGRPSGSAFTPKCSACCTTPSNTKARRSATAPIASPATRRATIQFNHRVYQRHGQACFACGKAQIVRIVQAQRSTFYCPACQRK